MPRFFSSTLVGMLLSLTLPSAAAESPLQRRELAREAMLAERWQDAASLYTSLVTENPDDGALWRALGLSLLRMSRHDEAIAAYERALRTGGAPATNRYDMACAHALAGRKTEALDRLAEAYAAGFADGELVRGDRDLASLHDEPRFRDIVGWPDPAVEDREERWRRDLGFLARRVREVHWQPFGVLSEAAFDAELATIRGAIDGSADRELRLRIQRLLASLGDGHTAIVSDFFLAHHGGHAQHTRFLPVEFFWYADGVRIVAATAEHQGLIGARLKSVGGVDADELCRRLDPYVSRDNEWGARWGIMQSLADPKTLEGLGIGGSDDGYEIDVERLDGAGETVRLPVGGREMLQRLPVHHALGLEPPLFYRDKEQHLWMEPLGSALYVRIDGVRDGHGESFHDFTERVFATARDAGSASLILDLRDNLGGQGHLTRPLLHRLIATDRFRSPGGLYVLVGRKTFSAAMALAAQLEMHTSARFVGEPTGSRPNFVGETTIVRLPYSKLAVSISSRYHQNGGSLDHRFWIAPDLPAPPSFAADRGGRDPAIEAVLADITALQPSRQPE